MAHVFLWAGLPQSPTPHTELVNDGLWGWRLAQWAGSTVRGGSGGAAAWEKTREGVRVVDLPEGPGWPCALAVWRPQGVTRGWGCSGRSSPSLNLAGQVGGQG